MMVKHLFLKKIVSLSVPIGICASMCPAMSFAATTPDRGADIPWITYEAENMVTNGVQLGPQYDKGSEATEASGRKAVMLDATNEFVQFTAKSAANSIDVRYSIPDSPNGEGIDATLSLYKNGRFIKKIPMTSKYSKLYGSYPWTNNPEDGSPRNFYDDARMLIGHISKGDVIRLQKDSNDTASHYTIDLVDLENVAPSSKMPANFVSITDFGAVANDGKDDTSALIDTINAAKSEGKGVWVPAGTFNIKGTINLNNVTIRGAGMWHTTFLGDKNYTVENRIYFNGAGSNIHLSDFSIIGRLNYRNDSEPNDGIGGSYGTGSTIKNIWVEHTKTGAWITNSNGLRVEGMRIQNTIADGINFCVGMRNSSIYNSTARGTGDDAFAIWPATYMPADYSPGFNVIKNVTAEYPWLANGAAIYGAESNKVEKSIFQDISYGSGVLVSTTFPGVDFSGTTEVQNNDIIRSGGMDPNWAAWRGSLQIQTDRSNISGLNVSNLNIIDSLSDGIQFNGNGASLSNTSLTNINIRKPGLSGTGHGIFVNTGAKGSVLISKTKVSKPAQGGLADLSPNFTIHYGRGNSGWSSSAEKIKK
jgi:hypothetical protein